MAFNLEPLRNAAADWIARGRLLADTRREAGWALADWMAAGREQGYLRGSKICDVAAELGVPAQFLKDALKAATRFPADSRDSRVSIEHHAALASLPADEVRRLLERAWTERLPVQAMREAVAQHRLATGERFTDEDTDSSLATLQIRAWNRATPEARALAFEHFRLAAAKGHGIVDEDEAAGA